MRHRLVRALAFSGLLIGLAATAAPAMTPGKITKEIFAFGERSIAYYLFVPRSVVAATPAPMVVLLHGSGRNGSTLVEPWKDLASQEGIILVGPDAQDSQAWNVPADGPAPLCALVLELQKTLPVDPRRVYVFGHSAGAVFTLYMSVLESGFFAAAALHAGAWRAQDDFKGTGQAERKIPIAIWVGDHDQFFSRRGRGRHRRGIQEERSSRATRDHQESRPQLLRHVGQGERGSLGLPEGPAA